MNSKFQLLSLFLFLGVVSISNNISGQTKYYFSTTNGDDAHTNIQAQNPLTPWKTITKLNSVFSSINPGDSILFKRGDVFYGSIEISKSGTATNPIVISSYGSGSKPIITGFSTISSWTALGNNIYEATISTNSLAVKCMEINGKLRPVGRYPKLTDTNEGYLTFESSTTNQITDNQLNAAPVWSGGEIVIRKNNWVISKYPITSNTGTKISFSDDGVYPLVNNSGYFIQNHVSTLTQDGDWCFDKTTKKIKMYYSTLPILQNIRVATIDQLLTINTKNYIKVSNIKFEGANTKTISADYAIGVNIENCDFNLSGVCTINFYKVSGDIQVNNNTINNSLNNGILIITQSTSYSSFCNVKNNLITNTGLIPGMGENNDGNYNGIYVHANNGGLVEYNTVKKTGYLGIHFGGNDISIKNNLVDSFCLYKDDGAGIYTYNGGLPIKFWKNRKVIGNIVSNGIGNIHGASGATVPKSRGIYMDNIANNVNIQDNTVYNIYGNFGSHNNSPSYVSMTGNTFYNVGACFDLLRWPNDGSEPVAAGYDISNLNIQNNIFFTTDAEQKGCDFSDRGLNYPSPSTISESMKKVGIIDNNYYHLINDLPFSYSYRNDKSSPYVYSPPLSFDSWKAISGFETNSKIIEPMPTYQVDKLLSSNLYSNGDFNSNINGVGSYSSPANYSISWDGSSKISGIGSLKLKTTAQPVTSNHYTAMYAPIGSVESSKNYIVRFSTVSSTSNGIVGVTFRQTNNPWASLLPVQYKSFGSAKKDHEFLIKSPSTESAASWQISIRQDIGETYIDNIKVYEVDSKDIDINNCVRLEVNDTKLVKNIVLDSEYVTIDGTAYNGSLTLQPFSSKILILKKYYNPSVINSINLTSISNLNCYLVNNKIILNTSELIEGKTYKISMANLLGGIVYNRELTASKKCIEIEESNLVAGVYVVVLSSDSSSQTQKIVIQ